MAFAAQQKKAIHSMLANKLTHLKIPDSSSSSSPPPTDPDFDFSDVFGAPTSPSSSSSFLTDPQIIHSRSHSFVGPSPRITLSKPLPFHQEVDSEGESDSDKVNTHVGTHQTECSDGIEEISGDEGSAVTKFGPGDFEILRMIGKGSFGKVFQVKMKGYGGEGEGDGILAMKVMRKDTVIKNNHVDYMRAERDILTKVEHPFIVQLRYSFQTKSKLYLILDFINGGHLFYHLYRQGIFSEDQARIYAAEIVSAVSHLHQRGIVHRDLKPENILMDGDGHVMLTDFGLAKEIDESSRSNSMCGTMEYMAPEIIQSKGHNKDADWWSVGVLLYEMLTGQPPFTHANRKKLQEKIISEKLKLLPRLTGEAHSLLKGLLQKDPSKRLGSGPRGGDEIKSHKWFRTINWKKLDARELQPKFKPDVIGRDCTANFDKCWTTMPPDDSPASTPTTGEHFQGYTYVAPNPWLSSS
ncbi:serine/threonine-protein kinase AtPK1/AtPK6 [Solanum lycopersicum]|uniref:non-specific serine/threonine protein kinase n=1 Tax=Solanum lycopersicum TaxID=4081 RepID=Q56R02_SOLLC|nr:serine/threonine-protein kinase AtPK1/AtPK6 [Solanum lycopersicum]AAX73301.1 putative ribosomal-protein S6 kinase-like protein [Solanum lycopersicum]